MMPMPMSSDGRRGARAQRCGTAGAAISVGATAAPPARACSLSSRYDARAAAVTLSARERQPIIITRFRTALLILDRFTNGPVSITCQFLSNISDELVHT
jgi:hypothetical protein